MRPGRAATAIAVGAALATLVIPTVASAGPTPAPRASSHGATPATRAASHGETPPARASAAAGSPAVPAAGSLAARVIGGPLMASQGVVVSEPTQHAMPLPDVPASAWVIANANTGQVLAAKDPHAEFGPASTLKVLTAITLIPLLNPNAMVIVSKLAASQEPASAGLLAGHAYKVSDLFDALLLISANDAAVALAEATGSLAKGMALINAEARHLQAYDVDAKLPNGLPAAGQVTSAYDEALIARQALAMPAFMHYDATLTSRLELKPGHWESMVNQNYLLTKYAGGIGGKIGWTVSSEATYVGLARRNGVTLIVTVLHCTSLEEITSAERLLNWGFAMNGKVSPVGVLVPPLPAATAARRARATGRPRLVALSATRPGSQGQHHRLHAGRHRRRSRQSWPRQPGQDAPSALVKPEPLAYASAVLAPPISASAAALPAAAFATTLRCLPRNTGTGRTLAVVRVAAAETVSRAAVSATTLSPVASAATAAALSLAATTVNLPSASAATNTITTPRPVKNPICSSAARVTPPTGAPARGIRVHAAAIRLPTANQAPASAASHAPKTAAGRNRLMSTTTPATSATTPGRTSSHQRPAVASQARSGV